MLWGKFREAVFGRKNKGSNTENKAKIVEGELIHYIGHQLSLDWDHYFYRFRSDDGKEVDVVVLDGNYRDAGCRIRARVVTPSVNRELVSLTDVQIVPKNSRPAWRPFGFKR